jgi:hypothetical protein
MLSYTASELDERSDRCIHLIVLRFAGGVFTREVTAFEYKGGDQ